MGAAPNLNFEPGIAGLSPKLATLWGFRSGERGTHTSRTIMLDELSQLLDAVPGEASRRDYAQAVTEGNCLGKRTAATRKLSLQRLSELYGLDARLLLFGCSRVCGSGTQAAGPCWPSCLPWRATRCCGRAPGRWLPPPSATSSGGRP